jgi:hypothetical protein
LLLMAMARGKVRANKPRGLIAVASIH